MIRAHFDFSRKVAVVTGGAQGNGKAVADHLRAAGATLSVWDPAVAERSDDATICQVDVSDLSAVEAASARTLSVLGKIDILVHCAGFAGETVRLDETAPSARRRVVEVNLIGTYNVCRVVVSPCALPDPAASFQSLRWREKREFRTPLPTVLRRRGSSLFPSRWAKSAPGAGSW